MPNALPSMEHIFSVKLKGEETGKSFEGTFKYIRPNIRIDSEIDKTRALLDGGIKGLTDDTKDLHKILATLRHTLIEFPEWWEKCDYGYELYDLNVILDIYMETRKFEKDFEDKLHGENKASKGNESTDKPKDARKGEPKAES